MRMRMLMSVLGLAVAVGCGRREGAAPAATTPREKAGGVIGVTD